MANYPLRGAATVVQSILGLSQVKIGYSELNPMQDLLKREGLWMAALEPLVASGEDLPPDAKLGFLRAVAWELSCRSVLGQVGAKASLVGLKPVVFKGISLACLVYRAGQRSFGDLDVSCCNGTDRQLIELLQELGGHLRDGEFPEVLLNQVRFDIHSHPLGQLAEALELKEEPWASKAKKSPEFPGVLNLAPEHEFLLALFHGAKHCFSRANWVVDVGLLAYRCDATGLAEAVTRHHAGRHLWLAQQCLKEWFEVDLPGTLAKVVSPPRPWDFCSFWLKNRVLARCAPDFLGMFTPLWAIASRREQYRYLSSTLFPPGRGWWARLRRLVGMATELIARGADNNLVET